MVFMSSLRSVLLSSRIHPCGSLLPCQRTLDRPDLHRPACRHRQVEELLIISRIYIIYPIPNHMALDGVSRPRVRLVAVSLRFAVELQFTLLKVLNFRIPTTTAINFTRCYQLAFFNFSKYCFIPYLSVYYHSCLYQVVWHFYLSQLFCLFFLLFHVLCFQQLSRLVLQSFGYR